jgi:N-acetylglutamate synthase-like GNAT family acetyltransferase
MSDSFGIEQKMLESLELFHYVNRFQHATFALIPEDDRDLLDILSDLRVMQASGIRLMVCCRYREGLQPAIERLSGFGYDFSYAVVPPGGADEQVFWQIQESLKNRILPVIAFEGFENRREPFGDFQRTALEFVCQFDVSKVFFPGKYRGIEINGKFLSHPTPEELREALDGEVKVNIGREDLEFLLSVAERYEVECIVLSANSGELFREVFTHRGAGTLFSKAYQNVMRRATGSDVRDIFFLMKPYLASGIILTVSPEEILRDIDSYVVYTVDNQIVASARCQEFGSAIELGKLCTLPRYQGRGRARELAVRITELAREQKKEFVFALTTSAETGVFFESVGFVPVSRQHLPESWKRGYDFSRPSKAYRFECF